MKDNVLTIIKDDEEFVVNILFTHFSEDFNANYVVFTYDEDNVSAAKYNPEDDGEGVLMDIETDEEWELIEDLFEKYAEDNELEAENE